MKLPIQKRKSPRLRKSWKSNQLIDILNQHLRSFDFDFNFQFGNILRFDHIESFDHLGFHLVARLNLENSLMNLK